MAPTTLFLDTEFTGLDDPYPLLISIGVVAQNGQSSYYAELDRQHWAMKADNWVYQNVVPFLSETQPLSIDMLGRQLRTWFGAFDEEVRIVCDSVEYDWRLVKPLLDIAWPACLLSEPYQFGPRTVGEALEPKVREAMEVWHTAERPLHHALHDAGALRAGWLAAREAGWRPPWSDG